MSYHYPTYTDYAPLPVEPSDEWNNEHDTEIGDEQEEFNDFLGGTQWEMPEQKRRLTECLRPKWRDIVKTNGSGWVYSSK